MLYRLKKYSLTTNLSKSHFFRKETKFLGFVLNTEGIKPDPEKIQGIKEFPPSKNIKQLRGFLELVNFYSKFSSRHSETIPLLKVMKKGVQWKWEDEMQSNFQRIEDLFSDSIILYYPEPKKQYYLETDTSDYALGAVLYQKNEKQEKETIAYFTTEKELLATVWVLQKFRTYLQGVKIIKQITWL